jgi:hypothetical protein
MPKTKSASAANIDKINRMLDSIADNFGTNSTEFTQFITEHHLDNYEIARTKSGKVHIRNTQANRAKHQRLTATAKINVQKYIRQERKKYRKPERQPGESTKDYNKRYKEKTRKAAATRYTRKKLEGKHAFLGEDDYVNSKGETADEERRQKLANDLNTALNNSKSLGNGIFEDNDTGEVIDLAAIPNFNPDFLG